jgi:hypothetical protein
MVIITTLRELFVLHRWLVVKIAKDPKAVVPILRLMLSGKVKNRKKRRYTEVKLKKDDP